MKIKKNICYNNFSQYSILITFLSSYPITQCIMFIIILSKLDRISYIIMNICVYRVQYNHRIC